MVFSNRTATVLRMPYFCEMQLLILAVGRTDDRHLRDLVEIYIKRVGRYVRCDWEWVPDVRPNKNMNVALQRKKGGESILKRLASHDHVVLLDERGKQLSSQGFADYLQQKMNTVPKRLAFVIGGPYGFSQEVYARAQETLSLSKMTFSHQMVRLFFAEQLYRAYSILNNGPYHHE